MNWLPPVDPAISPRVTGGQPGYGENPYIPKGMRQRASHTVPEAYAPRPPRVPRPPHEDAPPAFKAVHAKGRIHPSGAQTAREYVVAHHRERSP